MRHKRTNWEMSDQLKPGVACDCIDDHQYYSPGGCWAILWGVLAIVDRRRSITASGKAFGAD
jgi:hypothetical protein